jgi:hypothetical protein
MKFFRRNKIVALASFAIVSAASVAPAFAGGFGHSRIPLADNLFDLIGLTDLSGERRDLLAVCLGFYALCFGILTNMAIRERGFGNVGNGIVGVAGICLAIFLCSPRFHLLGDLSEEARFNVVLVAASFGSAFTLVLGAVVKGVALRLLASLLDLFGRPERPKPMAVEEEAQLPPRIAAALRKS